MVSWKTEYEYYNNNLSYNYGKNTLDFFKTNPTDKQILILDKREHNINMVLLFIFLYGLLFGGLFLNVYYSIIGVI